MCHHFDQKNKNRKYGLGIPDFSICPLSHVHLFIEKHMRERPYLWMGHELGDLAYIDLLDMLPSTCTLNISVIRDIGVSDFIFEAQHRNILERAKFTLPEVSRRK